MLLQMKILKKDSDGNETLVTWLRIGIKLIIIGILITLAFIATSLKFDSPSTVINAMSMDPNYTKISYSELDYKLIATTNGDKQAEFKLTKASFKYLMKRLTEKNKTWGDWTFKYQTMPPGKDHDPYKIYIGTREPKQ